MPTRNISFTDFHDKLVERQAHQVRKIRERQRGRGAGRHSAANRTQGDRRPKLKKPCARQRKKSDSGRDRFAQARRLHAHSQSGRTQEVLRRDRRREVRTKRDALCSEAAKSVPEYEIVYSTRCSTGRRHRNPRLGQEVANFGDRERPACVIYVSHPKHRDRGFGELADPVRHGSATWATEVLPGRVLPTSITSCTVVDGDERSSSRSPRHFLASSAFAARKRSRSRLARGLHEPKWKLTADFSERTSRTIGRLPANSW